MNARSSLSLSVDEAALLALGLDTLAAELGEGASRFAPGVPDQREAVRLLKACRALRARLRVPSFD